MEKTVFVGRHELFTRTGRLCILLSNGISTVSLHLGNQMQGTSYLKADSTARTEGEWLQCFVQKVYDRSVHKNKVQCGLMCLF